MKKNANIPILIVVIALVAVAAQFTRHSGEKPEWTALRKDLAASLVRLWDRPQQEIELLPGKGGVVVQARVTMPPNLPPRQQRWNYAFLRFVAQRHPEINVEQLEVVDAANRQKVSEIAMNGLLAEAYYPPREDEERNCAIVSRQLTADLEERLGRGEVLVLVDARRASSRKDDGITYGKVLLRQRPLREPWQYEFCFVTRTDIPANKWLNFCNSNPIVRTDSRKVTLP